MIYMAWATMHFCQTIVVLVVVSFDLLFLLLDSKNVQIYYSGQPIFKMLYWGMVLYGVIAIIVAYRAQACFKK
jgi:hypothetical protein